MFLFFFNFLHEGFLLQIAGLERQCFFHALSIDNGAGDGGTVTSQQVGHRFDYELSLQRRSCILRLTGVTSDYLQV